VKRHLIAVLAIVGGLIAGALGFLGTHFGDVSRAVDDWLKEAGYKFQNESIGPEWALTRIAEAAVPITLVAAGGLVLVLIWLVARGLRKGVIDQLPGSRRRRRTKQVAQGHPRRAEG